MIRHAGRSATELRPLSVTYGWSLHAAGSVLLELGRTKILASVMVQAGVPPFMRGKRLGWLTAEYALLPAATAPRAARESVSMKRSGRSVEISRLIGRAVRSVVNLDALPDCTVHIDCDVMNADGSTRSAAIIAASLALREAQVRWLQEGVIKRPYMREELIALSVGIRGEDILIDLDYAEDSSSGADFTVVMVRSGNVIEINGGAEGVPVSWEQLERVSAYARSGWCMIAAWYERHVDARYASGIQSEGRGLEVR